MKAKFIIVIILIISINSYAQNTFDSELNKITTDFSLKLKKINKRKIVVLFVTDIEKKTTNAGKYIADIISVNLVNSDTCFKVFDRDNLGSINEAKKLIAEGYIDAANAKELSKILSVEAIIIGNYTVLSNSIKLTLKALDSESGFIVAASMKDLPLNQDAGALLGINVNTDSGSSANRGFNAPVPSNENINNPNTVSQECETQKTGDYCFTNNTQKRLKVICTPMFSTQNGYRSSYVSGSDLTLELGQTQCFYNLDAGSYEYSVEEITNSVNRGYQYGQQNFSQNGQILVEKCKSKTLIIK